MVVGLVSPVWVVDKPDPGRECTKLGKHRSHFLKLLKLLQHPSVLSLGSQGSRTLDAAPKEGGACKEAAATGPICDGSEW